MSAASTVKVAGEDRTIVPPRAFKAIVAGEIISRSFDQVTAIMEAKATFEQQYRENHTTRITRGLSKVRGYGIPDEDFGEDGYIDLPEPPTREQTWLHVFPLAFKLARTEATQIVGLLLVDDNRLMDAEANGQVEELCAKEGRETLFKADLGELIELLAETAAVVEAQFAEREDAVGKLRGVFSRMTQPSGSTPSTEQDETGSQTPDEYDHKVQVATVEQLPTSSETPSTPSPTPTDGPENEPSSESPSSSFAGSPSG